MKIDFLPSLAYIDKCETLCTLISNLCLVLHKSHFCRGKKNKIKNWNFFSETYHQKTYDSNRSRIESQTLLYRQNGALFFFKLFF